YARARQPDLHRVAQPPRPRPREEPLHRRVVAPQRAEDARRAGPPRPPGGQAPGRALAQIALIALIALIAPLALIPAGQAAGGDQRQGEEPGIERGVQRRSAGEEALAPEAAGDAHVEPAEQRRQQPL